MIITPADLVKPKFKMSSVKGDWSDIVEKFTKQLERVGNSPEVVSSFIEEANSDGYTHLLNTLRAYGVEVRVS